MFGEAQGQVMYLDTNNVVDVKSATFRRYAEPIPSYFVVGRHIFKICSTLTDTIRIHGINCAFTTEKIPSDHSV